MSLINRYNFLVWSTTPPEAEHLTNLPLGGPFGRVSATIILTPGELSEFYLNAPNGINLGANPTVSLVADRAGLAVVAANVGTMVAFAAPGLAAPQYSITISVPEGLQEEYYRLKVGAYYSNRIWYRPSDVQEMSAVFSFRAMRDLAYIPYSVAGMSTFRQSIRLKCMAGNPQTEAQVEDYSAVTTGKKRVVSIQQNLYRQFTCLNADAIAHEGFVAMLNHKDLIVNGVKMGLKTAYNSATDSPYLANGTFELWEQDWGLVSQC